MPWRGRAFGYTRHAEVGRVRQLGLGALHTISLAEARKRALAMRQMVLDGIDPIEASRADRAAKRMAAAKLVTFQQCADQFIAAHQSSWRSMRHRGQWLATLSTYAFPVIGGLSVSAIDTTLVLKVLEPIWATKTETALRLRGRIEQVLDWAKVRGHRSGENPARWRGHLDKLLAAPTKLRQIEHHPALAYAELPSFMSELAMNVKASRPALSSSLSPDRGQHRRGPRCQVGRDRPGSESLDGAGWTDESRA